VTILFADVETYCETPIDHGVYRYAETAEVLLFGYAIGGGPVQCWDVTTGDPMPQDLRAALGDPSVEAVFHRALFDRVVLRHALKIDLPIERIHCTHDRALAHSLPGSLDKLCDILGVPQDQRKHKTGKQLIQLFCKPRPNGHKFRRATRLTHPAEWAQFIEYSKGDIAAMRAIYHKLPRWNYQGRELDLWRLDQRINDRGVYVDRDLARAAIAAITAEKNRLECEAQKLTSGAVRATTQRDALLAHLLTRYGVALPDTQASTLERRIEDPDLPEPVRELLLNRIQASSNTAAKYARVLNGVSADGCLRGLLQFCGASRTGRWAGRLLQPQNLFRPPKHLKELIEPGIAALKAGGADLAFGNVTELVASCVRGSIIARPGNKLVVSDLANIEGRMAAWLAGEEWKLKAFREYDAGAGPDLYKLAYARSFATAPDRVDEYQRQIGKVQELMLQYEGGVGAFLTGADTYNINLEEMADKALGGIPSDVLAEAQGFLDWLYSQAGTMDGNKRRPPTEEQKLKARLGVSERVFLTCDSLKRLWRAQHPAIVSYWGELTRTVQRAIDTPGNTFACRRLVIDLAGNWLRIRLPSGRFLCYPFPKVNEHGEISYMGVNQYSRKWERIKTYGGKLFENITQAASRDVMAHSMMHIEGKDSGYKIVMTVHDELVTEAPDSPGFNAQDLSARLATVPSWAPDLPLAADGFEAHRYRKD